MEGLLLGSPPGPPIYGTVPPYTKKSICSDVDAAYFDNFAVISREELGLSTLTLILSTSSPHVPHPQQHRFRHETEKKYVRRNNIKTEKSRSRFFPFYISGCGL